MFSLFGKPPSPVVQVLDSHAAPECARIHAPAFAHPWSEEEFERLLGSSTTIGDGIFDNRGHAMFGFILSQVVMDEAEVLSIVIEPYHRRHGFGRLLLDAHIERLTLQRVKSLFLEVEDGNGAARALYARLGFHEIGKREGYYRKADGSRATALILRRDLG